MDKKLISVGVAFIFIGIVLGAFASHGLESMGLAEGEIESFEVGVRYMMITGISFLALAGITEKFDFELKLNFRSILWGTILFSGSIFIIVLAPHILNISLSKYLWPVTPFGGLIMILGWFSLFVKHLRNVLSR
jgi:uncharacterized membrane protein YgdD (TMEM256/DUF423 family)